VTDLKREFCVLAIREDANICQLSRRFGIAAKTGHKWLARYRAEGVAGLEEMSRRPHLSPGRSAPEIEQAVLEVYRGTVMRQRTTLVMPPI
jgi:transposase-like protein